MAIIHSGQTKMQVTKEKFDSNWNRTFGKKKEKAEEPEPITEETIETEEKTDEQT